MKKLFFIFAKLLGLFQLYTALMGAMQIIIMIALSRSDSTSHADLALGAAGLLLFLGVSIAIARILIVKTEWLAGKVGIRDEAPVEGLAHIPALQVGICLIGVLVTVQSLPQVARMALTYRNIWANISLDLLWPQLLPSVLQLALGLLLALKPRAIANWVDRSPQSDAAPPA